MFWELLTNQTDTAKTYELEQSKTVQSIERLKKEFSELSFEEQNAMLCFIQSFVQQMEDVYLIYKRYAEDDTFWNNLKDKLAQRGVQQLTQTAGEEIVGAATSSLGESNAELAKNITSTAIQGIFLAYSIIKDKKKETRKGISKRFKEYATTEQEFRKLSEQVGIHLFSRFKYLIFILQRPDSLGKLVGFFQSAIFREFESDKLIPSGDTLVNKIDRLLKVSVPSAGDPLYQDNFGKIEIYFYKEGRKVLYTIEGALCRSACIVKIENTQEIYGRDNRVTRWLRNNVEGMRMDNKYPPQILNSRNETVDNSLRSMKELIWNNFENKLDKEKKEKLNVLEKYSIFLLENSIYFTNKIWLGEEFIKISNEIISIYNSFEERIDKKAFFETVLLVSEKINTSFSRFLELLEKDNIFIFSYLSNILFDLYQNSEEQNNKKWGKFNNRIKMLGYEVAFPEPRDSDKTSIKSLAGSFRSLTNRWKRAASEPVIDSDQSSIEELDIDDASSSSKMIPFDEKNQSRKIVPRDLRSQAPIPLSENKVVKVSPDEIKIFLDHVVNGKEMEAMEMLKKNKDIALAYSNIKDPSGKQFNHITGFQYAVWAMDWHMWNMVKEYLSEDNIKKQLKEIYSPACLWKEHNHHADWNSLLGSYKIYHDNWGKFNPPQSRVDTWVKGIGSEQRALPVHVVNTYCAILFHGNTVEELDKFFKNPDAFKKAGRHRTIDDNLDWYTGKKDSRCIGESFAVFNRKAIGNSNGSWNNFLTGVRLWWGNNTSSTGEIRVDNERDGFYLLYQIRKSQRDELIEKYLPGIRKGQFMTPRP